MNYCCTDSEVKLWRNRERERERESEREKNPTKTLILDVEIIDGMRRGDPGRGVGVNYQEVAKKFLRARKMT